MAQEKSGIYDIQVATIDGKMTSLEEYRGKTLLIVNTASKCGFTGQYAGLQELYDRYKNQGFVVLAFPANDFMGQEPGTNEAIKKFCDLRFKIAFPLFAKISVKGKNAHPLYQYLTNAPAFKGEISWNFNKFLVSPKGEVVGRFGSRVKPSDEELVKAIEAALPKKDS
ncbi:MAG: glutathione peroxidase [Candidatus Omnitrophota bacterium]